MLLGKSIINFHSSFVSRAKTKQKYSIHNEMKWISQVKFCSNFSISTQFWAWTQSHILILYIEQNTSSVCPTLLHLVLIKRLSNVYSVMQHFKWKLLLFTSRCGWTLVNFHDNVILQKASVIFGHFRKKLFRKQCNTKTRDCNVVIKFDRLIWNDKQHSKVRHAK